MNPTLSPDSKTRQKNTIKEKNKPINLMNVQAKYLVQITIDKIMQNLKE